MYKSIIKEAIPGLRAYNASWYVEAPWAHPAWDNYVVLLYDLFTVMEGPPPLRYMDGATHEVMVYALHPDRKVFTPDDGNWDLNNALLRPANHAYQFTAESDQAAFDRIDKMVRDIDAKELSPDTDFTRVWDTLFCDGVTLKRQHRG